METKDDIQNGVRLLKPTNRKQRNGKVIIAVILLAIVVLALVWLLQPKQSKSSTLTTTITNLEKNSNCPNGLKQLQPISSNLANSKIYSNEAKETTLNYLMTCSYSQRNTAQGENYASELSALYNKNKNIGKQQQLTQYINYIKNYRH